MTLVSGNVINGSGRMVNLVDLLGGGTPVSDTVYDMRQYAPYSGNILKNDGSIVNLVNLLGGGEPIDDRVYDLAQYAPNSGLILGSDGKAYDLAALLEGFRSSQGDQYIARYQMIGTPNAPTPATLPDLSGHGNDLTLIGFSAYDANGCLTTTGAEGMYLPSLNLEGHSAYKLRIGFANLVNGANNQRIFNTADSRFVMFMANDQDNHLVQTGTDISSLYGYKLEWYEGSRKWQYHTADVLADPNDTHADTLMELTIYGNNVYYTIVSHGTHEGSAYTTDRERSVIIRTTASMLNGVYFFNRAAGDRGLSATITTLEIVAV